MNSENETNPADEQLSNPPSLGDSEEEYLRSTWDKLGVGQDGYLDQTQLALVCECIGMEKLSDEVIAQLFDKLDLDRDGRISFAEFLHLFQNVRPGKGEQTHQPVTYEQNQWGHSLSSNGRSTSVRSESLAHSTLGPFQNIDPGGTGFATFDATVECLLSLGVPQAASLLEALSFRPSQKINLRDLVAALHEELHAGLESGVLSHSGHAGLALHAAVLLMQHELSTIRLTVDHSTRECEKLRSDLQEANQRASLLAQEVDENHAKQETIRRSQLKQLEQRHADQLRMVQEMAQAERDQLVSQLQRELDKRQQQLGQAKEEETRLKDSVLLLNEDNARLSSENAHLTEQLASTERANGRLMRELDGVSLMAELESRCEALEESQRSSLTEQLNRLSSENLQLRDRNDELSAEVELLRGKLACARSESGRLGLNSAWRSEPTMSGAVKRRNDSDGADVTWVEDAAHLGKVRKRDMPIIDSAGKSCDEAPRASASNKGNRNGIHPQTPPQQQPQQSLAAQLQEVKQIQSSTMGIKEQLKRVFEKLRLQIVEEFLEDNDNAAVLQRQYHNVLRLQEDRHIDEKRNLIESYLLKVSALEAQLLDAQNRIDDLVQLQKVMEAEHDMEVTELRQQLKRVSCNRDVKQEEYDHLTEALADLDAALDKELNQQNDDLYEELDREGSAGDFEGDEQGRDEENKENVEFKSPAMEAEELEGKEGDNSKVEQLEEQCRTLVNELDTVKVEIVKIVLENEELRLKVKELSEDLEQEKKEADDRLEEKIEFETALLQQRIKQLMREGEEEKLRHLTEKNAIDEDRRDLESRLELLRAEFERLDDYWQAKLDEEREIYDQERDSTDEKFRALEHKIKEYEELLSQSDASSTSSLSTIEERANWEKQLNDVEEECEALRQQVDDLQRKLQRAEQQHQAEVERIILEKNKLIEEIEAIKKSLAESAVREEELRARCEQMQQQQQEFQQQLGKQQDKQQQNSRSSPRPVSPIPKPGILPPGYSPLKSKGWGRTPRSVPASPWKCCGSSPDGADVRKISGPSSLNGIHQDHQQQLHRHCRADMSVFQALNSRLKQQEIRCRELQMALAHQRQRAEQIMLETKMQHEGEINSLESMMRSSQETLHQMIIKHQQAMDKLTASDTLIMELYTENSQLIRALHFQSLSSNPTAGIPL